MIQVLVLLASLTVLAGTPESKAEKEVLAAMESWRQAMITRNGAVLEALYAPGLTYTHSNGKQENKAEAIDTVLNGKDRIQSIELSDTSISIYGTAAVVKTKITMRTANGDAVNTLHLDVLHVWIRNGSRWQMVARQAIRLNP